MNLPQVAGQVCVHGEQALAVVIGEITAENISDLAKISEHDVEIFLNNATAYFMDLDHD